MVFEWLKNNSSYFRLLLTLEFENNHGDLPIRVFFYHSKRYLKIISGDLLNYQIKTSGLSVNERHLTYKDEGENKEDLLKM